MTAPAGIGGWRLALTVGLCIAALARSPAQAADAYPVPARHAFPPLIDAIRIDGPLNFCGEPVPLDQAEVVERLEKEHLLMIWDRAQVILWLKRAGRYMPFIESVLAEEGMPDDLKYLPVIESALRPHAGSHKGAVGFWQFIRPTARRYGLEVNRRKDERRSLYASTRAAVRYLQDLHRRFGSWHLAAAAYNMGEQGLEAEMLAQEEKNYYRLYLPLETQRYVVRAIVAKRILSDPDRFGLHLTPEDLYPPPAVDRVTVKIRRRIPLLLVARASGTDFKAVKDLNPELRGHYLAAGRHTLRIPAGQKNGFDRRLAQLARTHHGLENDRVYVVRRGDNLTAIAERFGVPLQALLIWNRLDLRKPIHPGDRLVVRPPE